MKSRIIEANINVHTRLAPTYNVDEPQFRPENKARVRSLLKTLRQRCPGGSLLDVGCGTGFIVDLAKDFFDEIHGVDVTPAMLDEVDCSCGRIVLHQSTGEDLPFNAHSFDMATAYSFLHHVEDYRVILREVYRVLRPGGLFYIDQEPNRAFWNRIIALKAPADSALPHAIAEARTALLDTGDRMEKRLGLEQGVFCLAEFGKAILGGIDYTEFTQAAQSVGFRTVEVRHEWFLGEADILHKQSIEAAFQIAQFLRSILPLSDHLFKYLQFIVVK